VLDIYRTEIDRALALVGRPVFREIGGVLPVERCQTGAGPSCPAFQTSDVGQRILWRPSLLEQRVRLETRWVARSWRLGAGGLPSSTPRIEPDER
jgi:hypothetical protein